MFALTLLALSAGSLVSAANFSVRLGFFSSYFGYLRVFLLYYYQVEVGGVGLRYTPNNTIAAIGDTVTFLFAGGAHSVTESTFEDPCALYQNASTDVSSIRMKYITVHRPRADTKNSSSSGDWIRFWDYTCQCDSRIPYCDLQ